MKYIILTLKALFLAIVGYLIYSWDNFTYIKGSTEINTSFTMEEVWQEYKEYWLKNEPTMTAPDTCTPHTEEEIRKLENILKLKLPEDLKISFKTVNHLSKKCDDNLVHSWFGSKTGVSLSTPFDIIDNDNNSLQTIDLFGTDYNIYDGQITPYDERLKQWPNEWILIADKYDVIFFIDLRDNIGDEYGQVIAYMNTFEIGNKPPKHLLKKLNNYTSNPNNYFNHFVFIAKDYKTFMQLMLEEIRANGKLKDRYLTNLFHLPADYFW